MITGRRLEDKLMASRIGLRAFTLNLNTDELHKNRESPSAYVCYLGVSDVSLPGKGTAHRKVRGAPEAEVGINESIGFCSLLINILFHFIGIHIVLGFLL